jgi:hypothetical protein
MNIYRNSSCRIIFLLPLLLSTIATRADWAPAEPGKAHCCASESDSFRAGEPELILKRFQIYKDAGFDMLRVEGIGSDLFKEDGTAAEPRGAQYIKLANESGFRVKMNVNVLGQASWYFTSHPGSQLINEDGGIAVGEMSFWDPDTRKRAEECTDVAFKYMADHKLFQSMDLIAPDFGPASEPIYPAAWTQSGNAKKEGEAFWFYANNAQADFVRRMQDKYQTTDAANAAWHTALKDWREVRIPQPGTRPGRFWEDVLTWYRDAKRNFVIWQIGNFKKHLAQYPEAAHVKILLYVPGTHYSDEDWQNAVQTGNGKPIIRIMCDSRFLLDTAIREHCQLQYTGCENEEEVKFLLGYLKEKGKLVPMWGENAEGAANQAEHIADVVVYNGLAGLDYTHTSAAFEPNMITPNVLFPRVVHALARIKAAANEQPVP